MKGYFHSAATLNYARALIKDGFADVRSAENWDLGFVKYGRILNTEYIPRSYAGIHFFFSPLNRGQ